MTRKSVLLLHPRKLTARNNRSPLFPQKKKVSEFLTTLFDFARQASGRNVRFAFMSVDTMISIQKRCDAALDRICRILYNRLCSDHGKAKSQSDSSGWIA